jgi:hypothetical protein
MTEHKNPFSSVISKTVRFVDKYIRRKMCVSFLSTTLVGNENYCLLGCCAV